MFTIARFESLISKSFGPGRHSCQSLWELCKLDSQTVSTYLNDMPYCATAWKFAFHTKVTSQAFVACSLHDKKAETALPPTMQ